MTCDKCGKVIPESISYCPTCKINSDVSQKQSNPPIEKDLKNDIIVEKNASNLEISESKNNHIFNIIKLLIGLTIFPAVFLIDIFLSIANIGMGLLGILTNILIFDSVVNLFAGKIKKNIMFYKRKVIVSLIFLIVSIFLKFIRINILLLSLKIFVNNKILNYYLISVSFALELGSYVLLFILLYNLFKFIKMRKSEH